MRLQSILAYPSFLYQTYEILRLEWAAREVLLRRRGFLELLEELFVLITGSHGLVGGELEGLEVQVAVGGHDVRAWNALLGEKNLASELVRVA